MYRLTLNNKHTECYASLSACVAMWVKVRKLLPAGNMLSITKVDEHN